MEEIAEQTIRVVSISDVNSARRAAKTMARTLGFDEIACEEIAIATSELASNLANHTPGGDIVLTPLAQDGKQGIEVQSLDRGDGIDDIDRAMEDGFSTGSGLGYGLGAVNRLMDEFNIHARADSSGMHIRAKRWLRSETETILPCPLDVGVATQAYLQNQFNGDTFIVVRWQTNLLVGVIDGLGHGIEASRASQAARHYIESHHQQPIGDLFRNVGFACRGTRGVVMALAKFDWKRDRLTFGSVGNIETRVFNNSETIRLIVRRGVIGLNAPKPVVTEHPWATSNIMVMHTDGLKTSWGWDDFADLGDRPAEAIAHNLLKTLGRDNDDATALVIRGVTS